ncbi:dynein axonemal intermediate chain 4 [Lampris incognitus]|uniref:dynein axonemal intermediate chain 4 n=1 Tax=Lampris incognitus TaxID=2546036 RepID=UPI0024B498E6|nr:dynein axonemal intermediate chain 4 [Lampris incognitus]
MSTAAANVKKRTLKRAPSSRAINDSTTGVSRTHHGTTRSRIAASSGSRESSFLAVVSKVTDKNYTQTPRQVVQVFDENGKDRTPLALYQLDPTVVQTTHHRIFASETSGGTSSNLFSALCQTTHGSFPGPFSRPIFGSSTISISSQSTMESVNEENEDPSAKRDIATCPTDVQVRKEEVEEQVREDMLDNVVDCIISETETLSLLDLPNVFVSADADDAEAIRKRNSTYSEVCKNRMGNDKYVERWTQTFNGAPKSKGVQADCIVMVDAASTATTWDMYDSFFGAEHDEPELNPVPEKVCHTEAIMDTIRCVDKTMSLVSTATEGSISSTRTEVDTFMIQVDDVPDPGLILLSEKFQHSLLVIERTILENIFQPKLAAYRQLPILQDPYSVMKPEVVEEKEKDMKSSLTPALEHLWAFSCELTAGRNISCMAWNKINPDILAVGYGEFDFKHQKSGLVCCWSFKNPMWPERVYHFESSVSALDFSACNASQLAVGMHDGSIAIYNVQSQERTPLIRSEWTHKDVGSILQVKWIEIEMNLPGVYRGEALISISTNGRIRKWYLHKNLECIDLMKLTRITHEKTEKQAREKKREPKALTSTRTAGLCFDFHPTDSNIYLAGTQEGLIHMCSCSINEQFLETYRGHKGPVFRITWCPFCPDVFLSCSSDWTIQLWVKDLFTPILGFTSNQKAVYDIMWSPKCATVFGVVNEEQVEIWDLGSSILDPIIVSPARPGVRLTSLLFTMQTDCIEVGDSEGQVYVYLLKNLTVGKGNQVDTLEDIITSALGRQL